MRILRYFLPAAMLPAAMLVFLLMGSPAKSHAQVAVGVQVGDAPICPYGYYDYVPYDCAPYGYYGPEWFNGGIFIGAGPWFHGPREFYGSVNHAFDPHFGYHGEFPHRGEVFHEPEDHWHSFSGSHMRDGHGHERPRD